MPSSKLRTFLLLLSICLMCGCTAWQPTKEVWKTTRGLWNTYVSPPANVDYEDKGNVSPEAKALASAMIGIDTELGKLERVMQNADKPPTHEWLASLFQRFPWLNGFAGVRYDGVVLGQEPPDSLKQLDFIPLLYEDKKQRSRALRADVQPGPLGPEVMLATPLYDGVDFLGIVVAYFDMRSLMRYSSNADDIVVLCPTALLWPGKYDFAQTPLAGLDWAKVARESTAGTCSNAAGSFYYMIRYLGNLPMIFAIPASGTFAEGNGSIDQGKAFFPQEREKLPPPPLPEGKSAPAAAMPAFEKPAEPAPEPEQAAPPMPEASDRHVIQQGSRESMLLERQRAQKRRQIQERMLEGENIEYQPPRRRQPEPQGPTLELIPDADTPTLPGGRPSPFGPRGESETAQPARPSPFGPRQETEQPAGEQPPAASEQAPQSPQEQPAAGGQMQPAVSPAAPAQPAPPAESEAEIGKAPDLADGEPAPKEGPNEREAEQEEPRKPAMLPGGRPSPFGPR